jgi:hypothetical protein
MLKERGAAALQTGKEESWLHEKWVGINAAAAMGLPDVHNYRRKKAKSQGLRFSWCWYCQG